MEIKNIAGVAVGKDKVQHLFMEILDPQIFAIRSMMNSVVARLSNNFMRELEDTFRNNERSKVNYWLFNKLLIKKSRYW